MRGTSLSFLTIAGCALVGPTGLAYATAPAITRARLRGTPAGLPLRQERVLRGGQADRIRLGQDSGCVSALRRSSGYRLSKCGSGREPTCPPCVTGRAPSASLSAALSADRAVGVPSRFLPEAEPSRGLSEVESSWQLHGDPARAPSLLRRSHTRPQVDKREPGDSTSPPAQASVRLVWSVRQGPLPGWCCPCRS